MDQTRAKAYSIPPLLNSAPVAILVVAVLGTLVGRLAILPPACPGPAGATVPAMAPARASCATPETRTGLVGMSGGATEFTVAVNDPVLARMEYPSTAR